MSLLQNQPQDHPPMIFKDEPQDGWVEASLTAFPEIGAWLTSACTAEATSHLPGWKPNEQPLHMTLVYGIRASEHAVVNGLLPTEPVTVTLGKICKGSVSPVFIIEVLPTEELVALFWRVYGSLANCPHTLIDNVYKPHITLGWFDGKAVSEENVAAFEAAIDVHTFVGAEVQLKFELATE
ncbi:Hypothetical protein UVM_LOCUS389 [uncultured virus]|nr:Hypothetical protein UVM_LOCUS389 [uncultured virus]